MECELIKTCSFINKKVKDMPRISKILKKNYCNGDVSKCARYMVFNELGVDKVPFDMFPYSRADAMVLIREHKGAEN
jgi:hypothetical protein